MKATDREDRHAARHPGKGRAVLACRCGEMLDMADMRRPEPQREPGTGSAPRIEPIVYQACAVPS